MTATATTAIRCSAWARAEGLDPIGSAGSYRGYLMIELPLPWPRDISEHPEVAPVAKLASEQGYRIQALVPDGDERRVIAYLGSDDSSFSGFRRCERKIDVDLSSTVRALLDDPPGTADGDQVRELLVCTHGRRDVCCGSLGTQLASRLKEAGGLPEGVRLWRTSHTGGHRFAATFIVLPEATLWAYADEDLIDRVLRRRGDAADVAERYRGCSGLGPAPVQALEREVLRQAGWEVLDRPRRGEVGEHGLTRLVVDESRVWEATVEPGRVMPVPDCGRPISEAKKSESEWLVQNLRRL